MNKQLFFAHANGFPAEVYTELFNHLDGWEVNYIPMLGHGKFPIQTSWKDAAPEIIDFFEKNYSQPIWAIGHSFGAISLAYAAEQIPDLFKGIIMMDPPVLSRKIRWFMAITQWLGISDKFMPLANLAAKRSDIFPSRAFVSDKLKRKSLFKNFNQASFDNYIKFGFEDAENGVRLRYKKEIETKVFALTPPFYKRITLKIPSFYIYANHGDIANTRSIHSIKHLFPTTTFIPFEGGHLFPLEEVEKTSTEILNILKKTQYETF